MVVLRSGRAVGNAPVLFGGQLEIALQARARVLRPLSFISMRKQHDERRILAPLGATGGDKLIDNYLRDVGKIAELRLPQDQCFRSVDTIAVLEAKRAHFAERAVIDRERRARLRKMLQGDITITLILLVQYGVTMTERTALRVLARQTDRRTCGQNRGESQRLGLSPVEATLRPQRIGTPLQGAH